MLDLYEKVEKNIDRLVEMNADWTSCATAEQLADARNGRLSIGFFDREVPREWIGDIRGKKVLCLAGAGGLQAPLLACAGAEVTVLDLSGKMLEKDRLIAAREGLNIELVKGNMCDLSMFGNESFDLILNPPSLMYVPKPETVYGECFRVLKMGGVFIMMAPAPVNYLCDFVDDGKGGYYKAVNRMPYDSEKHDFSGWVEFGHTMETYLGGQISAGFVINGYMECQREDITELCFMTRAVKPLNSEE